MKIVQILGKLVEDLSRTCEKSRAPGQPRLQSALLARGLDRRNTRGTILVHQMVHHLQNLGKLKYECPPAREALAYAAQDKWLALSELKLVDEFELDPFMLAVGTRCIY
jgi:hypothetical protein